MADLKVDFNKDAGNRRFAKNQEKYGAQVGDMAKDENREPKISLTEFFFITPFYLMSDAIDLALFMVGLDDFGIMDFTRTSIGHVYFVVFKNMGPEIWVKNLVLNSVKLVPYIGSLIPSTFIWIVIIFIDRGAMNKLNKLMNSKVGGKLVKSIASKVGKTAGKI